MATGDHADVPFVQAAGYTPGRPDGPPIWVVIHDMEYPERDTAAEATAQYFANPTDGRSVSSHYTADSNSVVQCVRLSDSAWTVGNRPGNYRGINWELAGYSSQTREQWLDDYGRAMLAGAAEIMRRDMATYAIPAHLLTDAEVTAFTPGITSHNQLRVCFGGTTHTDPGAGFPYDYLLDLLTEADVDTRQDALLYNASSIVAQLARMADIAPVKRLTDGADLPPLPLELVKRIKTIEATLAVIVAKADLTPEELAAIGQAAAAGAHAGAVEAADEIAAAIVAKLPPDDDLTSADVEAAVRAVFADAATPPRPNP